jgi:hypothetical protein
MSLFSSHPPSRFGGKRRPGRPSGLMDDALKPSPQVQTRTQPVAETPAPPKPKAPKPTPGTSISGTRVSAKPKPLKAAPSTPSVPTRPVAKPAAPKQTAPKPAPKPAATTPGARQPGLLAQTRLREAVAKQAAAKKAVTRPSTARPSEAPPSAAPTPTTRGPNPETEAILARRRGETAPPASRHVLRDVMEPTPISRGPNDTNLVPEPDHGGPATMDQIDGFLKGLMADDRYWKPNEIVGAPSKPAIATVSRRCSNTLIPARAARTPRAACSIPSPPSSP